MRNVLVLGFCATMTTTMMLATACPGSSEADGAGEGEGEGEGATGADLNGTWVTGCFNTGFAFAKTTISYDDLALSGSFDEFDDADCTNGIHTSHWTGTSTIAGTTATGETKIDIAYATFTSTPLSAVNATTNNSFQYCGFSDWSANVEKNILGAPCQGFAIPVGGESLDIYQVTDATLLFGTDAPIGTNLTEADRPTTLNENNVFTRQ